MIDFEALKKLDLKQPYVWAATWFGAGFLRTAPGTCGSAVSIPVGLIIFAAAGLNIFVAATALIILLGLWAADKFDKATGGHDNKMIVIDEAAGQWIALLPVLYYNGLEPFPIFLAFLLFRFFDVLKPFPVSWFDKKVEGAVGVMGDDIIAGLMAVICLLGIHHYVG